MACDSIWIQISNFNQGRFFAILFLFFPQFKLCFRGYFKHSLDLIIHLELCQKVNTPPCVVFTAKSSVLGNAGKHDRSCLIWLYIIYMYMCIKYSITVGCCPSVTKVQLKPYMTVKFI